MVMNFFNQIYGFKHHYLSKVVRIFLYLRFQIPIIYIRKLLFLFRVEGYLKDNINLRFEIFSIYLFDRIPDKKLFYSEIKAINTFLDTKFDFFKVTKILFELKKKNFAKVL